MKQLLIAAALAAVTALSADQGAAQAPVAKGGSVNSFYDMKTTALDGKPADLGVYRGNVSLVVNVASKCGFTPQYDGLEKLQAEMKGKHFNVLGFPSNDFGGQEPGTAAEIQEFCRLTYGVTFPLTEKVEVNGPGRHPLYKALTDVEDASGAAGDIQWNFEKFLVAPGGTIVARFRPRTEPESDEVVSAITATLPG